LPRASRVVQIARYWGYIVPSCEFRPPNSYRHTQHTQHIIITIYRYNTTAVPILLEDLHENVKEAIVEDAKRQIDAKTKDERAFCT
jgi:hypothetical protein